MKYVKRILLLFFALLLVPTGVFAKSDKEINVAAIVPVTGGGAFYGRLMRDIGQKVVDDINKAGIKGFSKMNIRFYDEGSDATVAAQQIQRASSQGANFLWGGFSSSVEALMVRKADELKLPTYLTNEFTYDAVPCKTKYALSPVMGTTENAKVCASYFKKKNVKTYAVIGADYVYGRSWDKALTKLLEGTKIKKVYENWHDFSKVDYSADIAKLKQLKPDAIIRPFGGAGEYVIIKQMKNAGYWPNVYIGNQTISGYHVMLEELGERYMENVGACTSQNPNNTRWIEFAMHHKEKYGYWPTWLSHGLHDTLWHIKAVVEKAGTLDPETIAKTMRTVTYNGVGGTPLGPFVESGYMKSATVYLIEFKKGSPKWSNKLNIHREIVDQLLVKPMCKEEVEAFLK